jgi:heme-degrading monooxygenase HmoA
MQARVLTVHIQPSKVDEAIRIYREQVVPAAEQQPGFKLAVLATDRSSGKGISITVWDGDGLTRSESSGYLQEQLGKIAPLMAAPPVREVMEVAVWEPARRPATHARILTSQGKPGMVDEAIAIYKEQALPVIRDQAGFGGLVLLVDRSIGKSISGTTWSSEADMRASEVALRSLLTKFEGVLVAPPTMETFELNVRHAAAQ